MMELHQVFSDMEPTETMRDFAIRKSIEADRARRENANLRDWIHDIAVNSGDEQRVMDAISSALSGETHGSENPEFLAPIAAEISDAELARNHVAKLIAIKCEFRNQSIVNHDLTDPGHVLIIESAYKAIDFAIEKLSKIYA
ncbi:hypothetical protein ERJ77_01785 [Vibrio anguillarum]|uniref:Uncharacterized protein n=1 Tax=Vibrio anguillarum TaxID=55601 RepID=A0AAW4BEK2_VIBAN|nr:hypothetical protein [Vibrio anguillarum]